MLNDYKEYIRKTYKTSKYPEVQEALIEYYDTMYLLTKKLKPDNFREKVWKPLLNLEVICKDPKFNNGIEEYSIKFGGSYPDNADDRKIAESAFIKAFKQIPNIYLIITGFDITPFLDLTPHLRFLELHGCPLIEPSPIIGTLKELKHLYFIGCDNLVTLPDSLNGMQNLIDMKIELCPKISILPKSLTNLPKLRKIIIRACDFFTSLPEKMGNAPELTSILIESCDNFKDLPRSLSQIPWLTINIKFCDYFQSQSNFPLELWKSCRILWTSSEEIWNDNIEFERSDNYPDYDDFTNTIFDREISWEKLESWFTIIPSHAFDELLSNALLLSAYSISLDVELPINRPCNYKNEQVQNIVKSITEFKVSKYSKIKKNPIYSKLIDIRGNLFSLFYDIRFSVKRSDYKKGYSKNIVEYKKLFSKVFIELVYHLDSWVEKNSNRLNLRDYIIEILNIIRPSFNLIKDNQEFNILM